MEQKKERDIFAFFFNFPFFRFYLRPRAEERTVSLRYNT